MQVNSMNDAWLQFIEYLENMDNNGTVATLLFAITYEGLMTVNASITTDMIFIDDRSVEIDNGEVRIQINPTQESIIIDGYVNEDGQNIYNITQNKVHLWICVKD